MSNDNFQMCYFELSLISSRRGFAFPQSLDAEAFYLLSTLWHHNAEWERWGSHQRVEAPPLTSPGQRVEPPRRTTHNFLERIADSPSVLQTEGGSEGWGLLRGMFSLVCELAAYRAALSGAHR